MTTNTKAIEGGLFDQEQPIASSISVQDGLEHVDLDVTMHAHTRTGKSSQAFKTISEVADELGVQQHVLRFWETKFSQIRPLKRGGGRRYYRPEDVQLLHSIHNLLYTEGYTIKGVQKLLREVGKKRITEIGSGGNSRASFAKVPAASAKLAADGGVSTPERNLAHERPPAMEAAQSPAVPVVSAAPVTQQGKLTAVQREILEGILGELKDLRAIIKAE